MDIPLAEGVTVLGSDEASPHAIAHETVAVAHWRYKVGYEEIAAALNMTSHSPCGYMIRRVATHPLLPLLMERVYIQDSLK